MHITNLKIENFKFIRSMQLTDIENALILVGKNNTGKTAILDAVRAATASYKIRERDFNEKKQKISITLTLVFSEEDLALFHQSGRVSSYRRYETWYADFCKKLPSYQNGILTYTYTINALGKERYSDGIRKHNKYIPEILPQVYYIGTDRKLERLQKDLLPIEEDDLLKHMRSDDCIFESGKACSRCFQCIGLINQKTPEQLNSFETAKLLEYKLSLMNLQDFSRKLNVNFHRNGGLDEIRYSMRCKPDQMCTLLAEAYNHKRKTSIPVEHMGEGMRSIYMLSLLETYIEGENRIPSLLLLKDPETFLHPQLQKKAGEILYRLSKKNQLIFSTHSPDMIFNFNRHQIRQVILDEEYYTTVSETTHMNRILDDLGFNAGDLMNVSFVFIVEGKQDKSRLPLLLQKYYSEIYDEQGRLSRIAIITTNSCTNIKTYANLKYMNQLYLRDQFLMIRDGDGKDPGELCRQLCRYYDARNQEDIDKLPRVTQKNVLILKYYSFENYFLNPSVMVKLGILESEEEFYQILLQKWNAYLHKLKSGIHLTEILGFRISTAADLKEHLEEIKIYMRGHNLFDIFYASHRARETELLTRYIDLAPREDFKDILDAVDCFLYFDSRRRHL